MTTRGVEFGFYPRPRHFRAGPVSMEPLPDIAEKVAAIRANPQMYQGWVYAPPHGVEDLGGGIRILPYSARLFSLPKTHVLLHESPDGDEHLDYHLWALSFFTGMRLTALEAGFLDATPIEPGKLVDFVLSVKDLGAAVELAEAFWLVNKGRRSHARLFAAAVHALFLSQNPCRLLVSLLGGDTAAYVRTPVDARQHHGLDLK